MLIEFPCQWCGRPTLGVGWRVRAGKKKFCGPKCRGQYQAANHVGLSETAQLRADVQRFWAKVDRDTGHVHPIWGRCWIWTTGKFTNGYGQFWRKGGSVQAHRFICEFTRRKLRKGEWACHHCDNQLCVRPSHLFIGTAQDNKDDSVSKLRHAFGDRVNTARLTNDQVRLARELYNSGMDLKEIHEKLGTTLSLPNLRSAVKGKTWKLV